MTVEEAKELFDIAKHHVIMNNFVPSVDGLTFFSDLCSKLKSTETQVLPNGEALWTTATNGRELFYNPHTIAELELDKLSVVWLIVHEIGHIITDSFSRLPTGADEHDWNVACDMVWNTITWDHYPIFHTSTFVKSATSDDVQNMARGKTSEEVYHDLRKRPRPSQCSCQQGNGEGEGEGEGSGWDRDWETKVLV